MNIASLIVELEEENALEAVKQALSDGVDPLLLVEEMRSGMSLVGERFESREYFLPELVLSGELFKQAIAIVEPHLKRAATDSRGTVILGTVKGDVHDIGKDLVGTMLRCAGYDVLDLGVDVPSTAFVEKAKESGAGLVALSGLLTVVYDSMKSTVEELEEAGLRGRTKVIIGGGSINEKVLEYTGADAYGKDPAEAVRLAHRLID
jgi:5-methyltetrahydrofolate--homocysteine methyltransferase